MPKATIDVELRAVFAVVINVIFIDPVSAVYVRALLSREVNLPPVSMA